MEEHVNVTLINDGDGDEYGQEEHTQTPPPQQEPQQPLNIQLLYADDWRHDTLSAAEGSNVIQTPFLDSLAKQGVQFRYNCVTTSICWISRATLVMGQFYSRHRHSLFQGPLTFYD